jgi:hypothetical protein
MEQVSDLYSYCRKISGADKKDFQVIFMKVTAV